MQLRRMQCLHLCAQCGRTYWLLSHRCAIPAPSTSASLCIAFPVTATRPSSSPRTLSFFVCVKITATLSLEAQTLDGDESAVVSRALHLLHRWASRFGRSIAAAGRVCPNPPNAYRVAVRMCMCRHRMAFSHGTWALPSASDDSRRAYRSTCTVELLCLAARQRAARACSQFLQALPPHRDQLDGLVRTLQYLIVPCSTTEATALYLYPSLHFAANRSIH